MTMARKPSLTTLIRDAPRAPGAAPAAAPGAAPAAAPRARRRSKDRTISNAITITLKPSKNAAEIVRSVAGAFGWRETVSLAEDCNANVFWYERAITVSEVRHLNEHQRVNMIPGMHEMARKASLARDEVGGAAACEFDTHALAWWTTLIEKLDVSRVELLDSRAVDATIAVLRASQRRAEVAVADEREQRCAHSALKLLRELPPLDKYGDATAYENVAYKLTIDFDDIVQRGVTIVRDGESTWPPPPVQVSAAPKPVAGEPAPKPEPKKAPAWRTPVLLGAAAVLLFVVTAIAPPPIPQHFTVLVLSIIIGFFVIGKVHHALHTPLMSVTNAISGIIVVGAMLQLASGVLVVQILAAIAVLLASINIFGGFAVTRRMLAMFSKGEAR